MSVAGPPEGSACSNREHSARRFARTSPGDPVLSFPAGGSAAEHDPEDPPALMAKRTRYAGRPAGRRPASKPSGSIAGRSVAPLAPEPPVPSPSAGLTEDELLRAEAIEAEMVAREKAAIVANARRRAAVRVGEHDPVGDVNAPLAVRAAHEYAYVARDVRRILVTGGLMVAILIVLDVLVNVMGVVKI